MDKAIVDKAIVDKAIVDKAIVDKAIDTSIKRVMNTLNNLEQRYGNQNLQGADTFQSIISLDNTFPKSC